MIDNADLIKEQYFLEVSSPGIERVLRKDKHLEQNIGKDIIIKLFKNINNSKQLDGKLMKFDSDNLYIEQCDNLISIDRKNIALIKTKFEW